MPNDILLTRAKPNYRYTIGVSHVTSQWGQWVVCCVVLLTKSYFC